MGDVPLGGGEGGVGGQEGASRRGPRYPSRVVVVEDPKEKRGAAVVVVVVMAAEDSKEKIGAAVVVVVVLSDPPKENDDWPKLKLGTELLAPPLPLPPLLPQLASS